MTTNYGRERGRERDRRGARGRKESGRGREGGIEGERWGGRERKREERESKRMLIYREYDVETSPHVCMVLLGYTKYLQNVLDGGDGRPSLVLHKTMLF